MNSKTLCRAPAMGRIALLRSDTEVTDSLVRDAHLRECYISSTVELLSWFNFLRLESELAMTFIQSAKLYSDPQDSARASGNARKALAEIQRRTPNPDLYGLSNDDVVFLKERCSEIELALDAL